MQGLGLYTMEELKFSPSGVLYTRGPGQYKIPAFCDVPLKFNVYLLAGSTNPHAIYSSKVIHSHSSSPYYGCMHFPGSQSKFILILWNHCGSLTSAFKPDTEPYFIFLCDFVYIFCVFFFAFLDLI